MAGRQLSYRNEGSATVGSARTWIPQQGLIAAAVGVAAFACYYATLLPGLDLGDSASFQTGVGSLTLTPRHAYPLYYGLGAIFVWLVPGDPARAVNLASAVYGAIAVSLAVPIGARLSGSRVGGAAAGMFLAFSYTFWSQAITAEVYTLHLAIIGAAVLALLEWSERQTTTALVMFYAAYALGFGNHLSMILLFPSFVVFLLLSRRGGPADPLRLPLIATAGAIAVIGALQYAWNLRGLWSLLEPPASFADAVGQFWFDVTKADWRDTLVMTLSEQGRQGRPAMYWFDLRQQFGVVGVTFAIAGIARLTAHHPKQAAMLLLAYAANMLFAWTYNVGDAYIFFLPAHYVVALCAGAGAGACAAVFSRMLSPTVAATAGALLLAYPAWRAVDTFPALDRSSDNRAIRLLDAFTDRPAVYGFDANWQILNALEYYFRERKPDAAWFTPDEAGWVESGGAAEGFRKLADANLQAARGLIVTPRMLQRLGATVAGNIRELPRTHSLDATLGSLRPGAPYAFAVLRSDREQPLNATALSFAWHRLAATSPLPQLRQYVVAIGRAGEAPVLVESRDRPYRVRVQLDALDVDVRMESWLPTDTIRRAGFGHVIVNRRHVLTLERGISFAVLDESGEPAYESGLFAPLPRVAITPVS